MVLQDAQPIDREQLKACTTDELLDRIQELENLRFYNRQLLELACRDHVRDFRDAEAELLKAGVPEDDGYGVYSMAERIRMLAKHEVVK